MQFNSTDKSLSLIGDIDFLLFGDSSTLNTSYSLADRTRNINIVLDEVVADLYKADPNHKWDDTTNTNFPIATISLTAGKDHYTMLDSSLVVHRVRMKDRNGNFKTLTPKLRSELSDSDLSSTGTPSYYYKLGGAIFPIPVPDYGASAGVELEFQRGGNHFTTSDTTKEAGFNSQFHQILSIGAALRYAIANGMQEKVRFLSELKESVRQKMLEHYERRSPDERPQIKLKNPNINKYGL